MTKGCSNPGHGGRDSGAVGSRSLEKDINLQIGLKFARRMRDQGFEMVETRSTDAFMSLSEITDLANRSGADFFQSNHCNAGGGHGFEIYAVPGGKAQKYARVLESHLAQALGIKSRGVKTNQQFYVLVHTKMPAVLLELAFLDNASEEGLLLNGEWQDKAVEAMVQGWCEIYSVEYRPRNRSEPEKAPSTVPVKTGPPQAKTVLVNEAVDHLGRISEIVRKLAE